MISSITGGKLTIGLVCLSMLLGLAGATATSKRQLMDPYCKMVSDENESNSLGKILGSIVADVGAVSEYFNLNAGTVRDKSRKGLALPAGLIRKGSVSDDLKIVLENKEALEAKGVVPKMTFCDYYLDDGGYTYRLAYENFDSIANSNGRSWAFANLNKQKGLLKHLKAVKAFNDAGFYHNYIRASTIVSDSAGNIKFIDNDYMILKTPTTVNAKANGRYFDAPSLFFNNMAREDTDDLYAATLVYLVTTGSKGINHYFSRNGISGELSCGRVRSKDCIEFIANQVAAEISAEFGAVEPEFLKSTFKTQHDNWANTDFKITFAQLNLGTLIHGMLNQHKFRLNANEFMQVLEWLVTKDGRLILV